MGLVILLLAAILVTLLGAWPILFGLMALAIAGWLIYLALLVIQGIPTIYTTNYHDFFKVLVVVRQNHAGRCSSLDFPFLLWDVNWRSTAKVTLLKQTTQKGT
tara:strand:- start:250 stop:558 length:309 start_codon:yes stop_codon:yes gene_type:complete